MFNTCIWILDLFHDVFRESPAIGSDAVMNVEDRGDGRTALHNGGVCDEWYMDDGQIFVKPSEADRFLRVLDTELHKVGAHREIGEHRKSVARLLSPPDFQDSTWCTT